MGAYTIVGVFAGGTTTQTGSAIISFSTSNWDFGVITAGAYTYQYMASSTSAAVTTEPLVGVLYFYAGMTTCIGPFNGFARIMANSITSTSMSLAQGIAVSGFLAKYA